MISDRYSCQEHGKDKHEDCVACEVYGDIAELVERIAELSQQNLNLSEKLRVITNEGTEYCVAYNQGWEVGHGKGMERAAEMVEAQSIHSDFIYCGDKLMAKKIRKEIK